MATGAGKTYTACVFSHRLLEHAKFRRVLFLADRANLVRQTRHEFEDFRPPGTGRSFTELYNVQRLGPAGLDKDASVVIATIQRVYSMLTGRELSEEDGGEIGVSRPVASEPQRLVALQPGDPDRELRPDRHRRMPPLDLRHVASGARIFRRVHRRPDRDAVVAHDGVFRQATSSRNTPTSVRSWTGSTSATRSFASAPISASMAERSRKATRLPVRDKRTRAERYEDARRRISPTRAQELDRSVVVPNQIRTVLETYRDSLFTELFPGRSEVPKTLIFCKDDHHAEEVVGIVREVFGKGNDFAKKITYKTDGADPEQLIRQFRTDYNPRIAVTVDMIATGTDVKPLEVLIFLRDVKSALYFEQMKGRGARTITPTQAAPGDTRRRGKDPLRAGRRGRRDREPETRLAALGPRAEDRLRPAHRRDRRGPARRRRLLDPGGAARGARPQIDDKDRAAISPRRPAASIRPALRARLLDAIDPDAIEREADSPPEPVQKPPPRR